MITNALTVDVEDYFHVSAFASAIDRKDWDGIPLRVVDNTQRLLQLFSDAQVTATFFVLGWVAEREPGLVREIAASGHEVACHGYSHQLVYKQEPEVFRQETIRSKSLLEDITQAPVHGYRAASYSITDRSLWALDVLCEAGFTYDSSIFPVHHDRYGMPDSPRFPYRLQSPNGSSLTEFPLSTANIFGYRLPVAGGGYFRLYPYFVSRYGLSQINRRGQPFIFYMHPWEIDPSQPRVSANWTSRFRHYNNLDKFERRLTKLMQDFNFAKVLDVLDVAEMPKNFIPLGGQSA
jgi:polysaccharide deacetylase family protein (PEP-CTERM system associated)